MQCKPGKATPEAVTAPAGMVMRKVMPDSRAAGGSRVIKGAMVPEMVAVADPIARVSRVAAVDGNPTQRSLLWSSIVRVTEPEPAVIGALKKRTMLPFPGTDWAPCAGLYPVMVGALAVDGATVNS